LDAAQIKAGKKREHFAIGKSAVKAKKGSVKRTRGRRKTGSASQKMAGKSQSASATFEGAS
jgi:hypothetical protein